MTDTKVYCHGKAVVVRDWTKIHTSQHERRDDFAALSLSKMWGPQMLPCSTPRNLGTHSGFRALRDELSHKKSDLHLIRFSCITYMHNTVSPTV